MARKTLLIAGALGLIGRTLLEYADQDPGIDVIGLGRRKPDFESRARFLSVDLLDRAACERQLNGLASVTHVAYAAWTPGASRGEEVAPNLAMFRNLIAAIDEAAPNLEHVTLLQGAKAYGSHLGGFLTPARESDPRHMPPNFYYDQEDYLVDRQRGSRWAWTIVRPTVVYGFALGNPMNMTTVIAVYAAISKELGLPFRFPGTDAAYRTLCQAVDAELIARAVLWAGASARARNETFNITNGDLFRWSRMWPYLAERFGMPVAEPQRIPLAEFMSDKEELWNRIVQKHGLRPVAYQDLVAWPFGEFILNREFDHILDTTKLRDHGFDGYDDSFRMFDRQIERLQRNGIIPPGL